MASCMLVWALPGEWDQRDVDDPDAEARLIGDLRQRWSAFALDEAAGEILIGRPAQALRQARATGTLAWAVRAQGDGTPAAPLSTVTLSVALVDRVSDSDPGIGGPPQEPSGPGGVGLAQRASPLLLEGSLTGFVLENRVPVAGIEPAASMYSAQVFVVPPALSVMAVVSVSTFDPAREDEAREAAGFVARSVRFLPDQPEHE